MKLTKNGKILFTFIFALVVSLLVAFSTMTFSTARADVTPTDIAKSFSINNNATVAFVDDDRTATGDGLMTATLKSGVNKLVVKNQLAVKELGITLKFSKIEKIEVLYKGTLKKAIGVADDNGKYNGNRNVTSILTIDVKNSKVSLNDGAEESVTFANDTEYEILLNDVSGSIASKSLTTNEVDNYKQKTYAGNTRLINLELDITVASDVDDATLSIKSINPDNGNVNANQTFDLDADGVITTASPVLLTPSDNFAVDNSGNIIAEQGIIYNSFNAYAYSVIGGKQALVIAPRTPANVNYSPSQNAIAFNVVGTEFIDCKVNESDVDSIGSFDVVVTDDTDTAPEYNLNDDVIAEFETAFKSRLVTSGTYGASDAIYVPIGSSKYLSLPSFEDMVSDNTTAYSKLSYTIYYRTPDKTSSYSSKLQIPLASAGEYTFFVVFKDSHGNTMEQSDFYTVDKDDSEKVSKNMDKYGKYVFSFEILDNAPISVENVSTSQGKGYIGVKYSASAFNVTASTYNETYTLEYCATNSSNDSDWVVIPKASTITDKNYNKDGFTYEQVKDVAYDGKLTFVPDRAGFYRITCEVQSDVSDRGESATSNVIQVNSAPKVVKPDSKWLQNNVWSVVFLSVGTLCLIGIIILLFIKPKESTRAEDDE